jgi:NAD(P)H-hydrate repair Nnr-like enzyme with NAD(P)H-hydrate dehydratase domain
MTMAGSPRWKVYDSQKRYQAACKEIEAAYQLVVWYGTGSTIRDHHKLIVWTEGSETMTDAGNYDELAEIVHSRIKNRPTIRSRVPSYGSVRVIMADGEWREVTEETT